MGQLRRQLRWKLERIRREEHAAVGVIFAVMVPVLLLAVGAGVDFARASRFKAALQGLVDSAALAGASVYTDSTLASTAAGTATSYFNNGVSVLPTNVGVSAPAVTTANLGYQVGYTVTVTATATIQNSFMAVFMPTMPVSASATAEDPFGDIFVTPTFSCSASDLNEVYYYIVPANAPAHYIPPSSDLSAQPFASNSGGCSSANGNTKPIEVYAGQKIGFAFKNTTGGNSNYGNNGYGAPQGSVHWFYSSSDTISEDAYPSVTQNCSLGVVFQNGSTTVGSVPSGNCTTSTPQYSVFNCGQLSGGTVTFNWNDMGGNPDDKDYNDGVYTMNCNPPNTTARGGNGYGLQILLVN